MTSVQPRSMALLLAGLFASAEALAAPEDAARAVDGDDGSVLEPTPDEPPCPPLPLSLAEVCPALAGDDEVREANASWRQRTVRSIEAGAGTWELVVRGATATQEPRAGSFADVTVRELVLAPTDASCSDLAWVAVVKLDGALAEACHSDQALLRADDAFGREGRVVAVGKEGVLVEHRGLLFFLAPGADADLPEFDVVWQSGFHIVDTPTASKTAKGKAKPKPRKRGRRRR